MKKIDAFVDKLSCSTSSHSKMTNMYSSTHDATGIRKDNLRNYLLQMSDIKTKILLLGEAPGYNGCRLTGIPFTSEYILKTGLTIKGISFFGNTNYKIENNVKAQKESSATIVWDCIKDIGYVPLLWNAFPYHPHDSNDFESNRTPTRDEFKIGQPFLKEILNIFPGIQILAVGNNAERILKEMGVKYLDRVRHPARGGKNEFRNGVIRAHSKLNS